MDNKRGAGSFAGKVKSVLDFDGDVCPRDRHALRDDACPVCGWRPFVTSKGAPQPQDAKLPDLDEYRRLRHCKRHPRSGCSCPAGRHLMRH